MITCVNCRNLIRVSEHGYDHPGGWLCHDCFHGIPRKRATPISHLAPSIPRRVDTYIPTDEGVTIYCPVCGEQCLLSSTANFLVGVFIAVWVEIELEDLNPDGTHVKAMVEKQIPRTWRVDGCKGCTDKYNAQVLISGRINPRTGRANQGKPFLRIRG